MFKITTKTNMETLKNALGSNYLALKAMKSNEAKVLCDSIMYASKNAAKATRNDLVELVKETMNLLGDKFVEPVAAETKKSATHPKAENSIKPVAKSEKKDESTKTVVKKTTKKSPVKEDGVTTLDESAKVVQQRASKMPNHITYGDQRYELATDINSMDDLHRVMTESDENEVIFAFYFPKRNIRQFGYFGNILGTPKSFKDDLDITSVIYVSDEKKVAYTVSLYTEAVYTIIPEDFNKDDGVRIAGYCEFEIYRPVKEAPEKEEEEPAEEPAEETEAPAEEPKEEPKPEVKKTTKKTSKKVVKKTE